MKLAQGRRVERLHALSRIRPMPALRRLACTSRAVGSWAGDEPSARDLAAWELTLAKSYLRVVGAELAPGLSGEALSQPPGVPWQNSGSALAHETLWPAPFCVLSHGAEEPYPVMRYANETALAVFELSSWAQLTSMESRLTAPDTQTRELREQLLARVRRHGYIDDYTGVRVSATGRRFEIRDAVVWEVCCPDSGARLGQAATFRRPPPEAYLFVDDPS